MYVIASAVFGVIWQKFGFGPMFLVTALLYLPIIWSISKVEGGPSIANEKRMPVSHLFRDEGIVLLLLATFLSGISNSLFLTFGGIFAHSLGASNMLIGLMVSFGGLAELPMMFFNVRISNRLRGLTRSSYHIS